MWTLLNPIFLWAAVAAVIPLILHLIRRRKSVRIPFSTLRFLKLAQKRSSRRVRMENFLLWLLRTLTLLALAAAFVLPVIRTDQFGRFVGGSSRDVAIVLDVSYSMGYESGQRKVWDEALASAGAVVAGLRKGDRVCLYLADDDAVPLIEQLTGDLDTAQLSIRALPVRTGSSRLGPAVVGAVRALRDNERREKEIHIITDGQALPWRGLLREADTNRPGLLAPAGAVAVPSPATNSLPALLAGLGRTPAVFVTLVGPEAPRNAAVTQADVEPPLLLPDTACRVKARIEQTGPAQELAVSVTVDDHEVSRRTVALEENGGEDLVLSLPPMTAGRHILRLTVPPDALPLDDTLYALVTVRETMRVLCVGSEQDTFYLRKALNPSGVGQGMEVTRADPESFGGENLSGWSCVFLCNALPLSGQAILAIEEHVRRGGTLVVFPGDRASPKDYESWNGLPVRPRGSVDVPNDERVRPLRLLDKTDPCFASFKLPPGVVPMVTVQRELLWGTPEAQAVKLVAAGAEAPFLWSRTFGSGRVFLFAVSADRVWSTFPLSPWFLPMVHQIVQFGAGQAREPLYHWATRSLILSDALPDLPDNVQLTAPGGEVVPLRRKREEARLLLYAEDLTVPGIYRAAPAGQAAAAPVLAINAGRSESDLQAVDARQLPERSGVPSLTVVRDRDELLRAIDAHRKGRPLAEPLLWLALAMALAETILANRAARRPPSLTETLHVESSGRVTVGKTKV